MLNFEAFLAILIFSFVPVTIKYVSANPFTIGIIRLMISSLVIFFWWQKKILFRNFFSIKGIYLWGIGTVFFCHWITYFYAIKIGGASSCVLGMSTYGIQLMLFGSFLLNYHLRPKNYLSLFIVLIGLSQLLPQFDFSNNFVKGLMLGLCSASFYSLMPILHQKANRHFKYEERIFAQFFVALIYFSLFIPKTHWSLQLKDWLGLLFLSILGTVVAHSLWAKVTSQLPTYISGIIYYAITPTALILSHFLFGEVLSGRQVLGAGLIISAAIFNVWSLNVQK